MKTVIVLAGILCSVVVRASVPIPTTIEELAQGADHILVGHVIAVDMVDEKR